MEENFFLSLPDLEKAPALAELQSCNARTAPYQLALSEEQILSLLASRRESIRRSDRVEFGESALVRLIDAFCDSPYLLQENYEETLSELQECFYYFKNESAEAVSDDELIAYMRQVFDGEAAGSMEYLSDITLAELCTKARYGPLWEEAAEENYDEDNGEIDEL